MNEVKDENFKYGAYMALNCFYIGQYLRQINNIVII